MDLYIPCRIFNLIVSSKNAAFSDDWFDQIGYLLTSLQSEDAGV